MHQAGCDVHSFHKGNIALLEFFQYLFSYLEINVLSVIKSFANEEKVNITKKTFQTIGRIFIQTTSEPCKTRFKPALTLLGQRIRVFSGRAQYRRAVLNLPRQTV